MDGSPQKPVSTSPAVAQAAQLLLCLGKNRGKDMSLTAICHAIGIHKSKGYSILNALARYDFVIKNPETKTYSLGPALMPLGQKAAERLDITAVAAEPLQTLANETRNSVLLGIICSDQFYITGKYDGNDQLSVTVRQYQSLHITHGSHGKAIFAFLSDQERQRILNRGTALFYGKETSPDPKRLEQEFYRCRKTGYAVDNGDVTPGTRAVSAPIFDHNNRVTAAVVLVGTFPEEQFERLGKKTAATAKHISRLAGARILST
jgi:DNA-binding IclR family transcriptional regulator